MPPPHPKGPAFTMHTNTLVLGALRQALRDVLVRVSITVIKHHEQRQLGKGFISTDSSASWCIPEGCQEWNLEIGADVEAMEECCVLACSPCFLIAPSTASPEVTVPTVGRAPTCQSLTKKMHHRLSWRPTWEGQPRSWSSLLQNVSSLCQVDIKLRYAEGYYPPIPHQMTQKERSYYCKI